MDIDDEEADISNDSDNWHPRSLVINVSDDDDDNNSTRQEPYRYSGNAQPQSIDSHDYDFQSLQGRINSWVEHYRQILALPTSQHNGEDDDMSGPHEEID